MFRMDGAGSTGCEKNYPMQSEGERSLLNTLQDRSRQDVQGETVSQGRGEGL